MIFAPVSGWRSGGVGCAGFDRYVCSALELVRGSQARAITGPIALFISRFGWRLNFSGTTSDDWKGRGNRNLRFDIISPTRPASRQTYFYDAYKAAGGKLARAFKQC